MKPDRNRAKSGVIVGILNEKFAAHSKSPPGTSTWLVHSGKLKENSIHSMLLLFVCLFASKRKTFSTHTLIGADFRCRVYYTNIEPDRTIESVRQIFLANIGIAA